MFISLSLTRVETSRRCMLIEEGVGHVIGSKGQILGAFNYGVVQNIKIDGRALIMNISESYLLRSLQRNWEHATEILHSEQSLIKMDPLTGPITKVVLTHLSTMIYKQYNQLCLITLISLHSTYLGSRVKQVYRAVLEVAYLEIKSIDLARALD